MWREMTETALKIYCDECLSPVIADRLRKKGYDAVHARDRGKTGLPDHEVLEYCLREDRVIVTHDAKDFKRIAGDTDIHPGLIVFKETGLEGTWEMMESTLAYLRQSGNPSPGNYLVNRGLVVETDGTISEDFILSQT